MHAAVPLGHSNRPSDVQNDACCARAEDGRMQRAGMGGNEINAENRLAHQYEHFMALFDLRSSVAHVHVRMRAQRCGRASLIFLLCEKRLTVHAHHIEHTHPTP